MPNGRENLANAFVEHLLSEGVLSESSLSGDPLATTPIEALFAAAIRIACSGVGPSFFSIVAGPSSIKGNDDLCIQWQHKVLDWKVDFYFTVRSEHGPISTLVVECDGHDFHERTKEQAKRDRDRDRRLQDAGHRVYRFTGSEIYRNAFGCAKQVLKWAEDAAWRRPGER